MGAPCKIVSHSAKDVHILGGEALVFRAVACGVDTDPSIEITSKGAVKSKTFENVARTVDYASRVASDSYGVYLDHSAGKVDVSCTSNSPGFGSATKTSIIYVYDSVDVTIEVDSDAELNAAVETIRTGGESHYLISLASGTYTWPLEANQIDREGVLVSVEPDNAALGNVSVVGSPGAGRCHWSWKSVNFSRPAGSTVACYTVHPSQVAVLKNCSFQGASAGVGLECSPLGSARAIHCHAYNCDVPYMGVGVIRSCSAVNTKNIFAIDCSVVDGCISTFTTSGNKGRYFVKMRPDFVEPVAITNNTLVDQGNVSFLSSGCIKDSVITGNVASGTADNMVDIGDAYSSSFAHNTWNTTAVGGKAITVSGNVRSCNTVNNWIYPLTKAALKLTQFASRWEYNATSSSVKGFPRTITELDDPFLNNYMYLKKRTPVRTEGKDAFNVFSQGAKVVEGQIGALPFTKDSLLTSAHKSVTERPFFNFSGPAVTT